MILDPHTGSLIPSETIPEIFAEHLSSLKDVEVSFFSLFHLDSSDITLEHWHLIATKIVALYNDFDGFVIAHGTDTMAYSATAVSHFLKNLQKSVIFTGSQKPYWEEETDALINLEDAVYFASQDLKEVCISFCGSVYRASECTKWNTTAMDAFIAPNAKPLLHRTQSLSSPVAVKLPIQLLSWEHFPEVGILKLSPLITPESFKKMLSIFSRVVIEGFGAGANIPHRLLPVLEKRCKDSDFRCILKSQCFGGSVDLGTYAAGEKASRLGIISGKELTTEECVARLMFLEV